MLDAALTHSPVTHGGLLSFLFVFVCFVFCLFFFLGTFLSSLSIPFCLMLAFFLIYRFLSSPSFVLFPVIFSHLFVVLRIICFVFSIQYVGL